MSGIEAAGLAIGLVPIVIEILKSYRATRDRLKTFARYTQVVYDVQLRFRVAATNFSNDCQLLLKAVVEDARELSEMVEDPEHDGWQDASLEERFRKFLERDYELCEEVIVRIRDVLRKTQAKLSKLNVGFVAGNNESQQTAARRLYQAFNISRKESQYSQWLDELDHWNTKLGYLRVQRCKLYKGRNFPSGCVIRKAVPQKYSDIRASSQRLHKSLQDSWSCSNYSHSEHQAKLSLDAKAEFGTVQLDVAITCYRKSLAADQKPPPEPPIWLHVRSITMNELVPKPENLSTIHQDSLPVSSPSSSLPSNGLESKSLVQTVKQTFKRARIDKLSDQNEESNCSEPKNHKPSNATSDSNAQSFVMLDLKATKSICCHLNQTHSSTSTYQDRCLGYLEYLEATRSFKLIFYNSSRNAGTRPNQRNTIRKALPISKLLWSLRTLHQLTLAHQLAKAVLQYHSTSWLHWDWSLQDVACFVNATTTRDDIVKELQSLHLSTQFPCKSSVASTAPLEQNPEHLKCMYGIRNLTLAKLGVALVEIGSQEDIGSFSQEPMPHDVITARKVLLEKPSSLAQLGKNYLRIARKCIDCDFSCGDNLNENELQSAVYTDVVCALEDMIGDWEKFLGIK